MTNALVHGQPPVIVTIEEQPLDVLVTVSDESPAPPVTLPHQNVNALGERGLSIVEQVSLRWGTNSRCDGGKSVWAQFVKLRRSDVGRVRWSTGL